MPKHTRNFAAIAVKLQEHGYTVKLDSFRRSTENEEVLRTWSAFRGGDPEPFERSPIDTQLIFAFDTETFEWLEWLQANDHDEGAEWHLITIDPQTSPLTDADDWLWASPNKSEALGWLLEAMDQVRAEPLSVKTNIPGDLVIEGPRGAIATISPIEFQPDNLERNGRAVRCLRNLRRYDPDSLIARKLESIEGLTRVTYEKEDARATPSKTDSNRQCIDLSCANICASLLEALQPHVVQPIKLSLAQELVASYFGFDSWNTFRGLEKKRESAVYQPYRVSHIEVINDYETMNQQHRFYRNLASGIVGFGQEMKHHKNTRPINISSGKHFGLDNIKMTSSANLRTGRYPVFSPCQAIELKPILRPAVEYKYQLQAESILASNDVEQQLREYFFTGLEPLDRIKNIDVRFGYDPDDHLTLGSWVFSLNRGSSTPYIKVELIENVGNYDPDNSFTVSQHKACAVIVDQEFWLASDWHRKPKFHLKGLGHKDVEKLERAFFCQENWRNQDD